MKKIIFIFVFLLLVGIVSAENLSEINFDDVTVDVHISSGGNIESTSVNWNVDYVFANLTFFPREDYWQDILSKNFIYGDYIEEEDNYIYFKWNNFEDDRIDFSLDYNIKSDFKLEQIKNKIIFPINENDIPEEIKPYLEATETINSEDSTIIAQATSIANGKDDLYEIVFDTGVWVKENIDYDLNTLTENAQQDARWVLDNKEGVCDEITVLFIAMLRSVGIPAKFTSGSSYSNLINGFGSHAWAEVYFPGEGWVNFDVTYGQFGFIDASHIKFKDSVEAKESSINYGWRSNNVDINFEPLTIETELVYTGEELDKKFELEVNLLENQVGGGSYVPVEIKVKNLKNYYVPLDLYLTKSASLVEDNVKHVLIKPNEEKSVFWIIEVPGDNELESGYTYTSTIEFKDYFGSLSSEDLKYSRSYSSYSLQEAENKIDQLEEETESSYNGDLELSCKLPKETFYTYEKGNLSCSLKNKGNLNFNNLDVCFLDECKNINLLINGNYGVNFEFETDIESKEYFVVAENEEITKYFYVDINIVDSPNLKIENLEYDNELNFKDMGELKFSVGSDSPGYNVIIKMGNRNVFDIDKFSGIDSFLIPYEGGFFYNKDQTLIIEYEDNNGKKYNLEEELNINVLEVPFYIKILDFIGLV